jgi:hypothetical protein
MLAGAVGGSTTAGGVSGLIITEDGQLLGIGKKHTQAYALLCRGGGIASAAGRSGAGRAAPPAESPAGYGERRSCLTEARTQDEETVQ